MTVRLEISSLSIDFDTRFPEYVRKRCEKYLAHDKGPSDLLLRATDDNIQKANAEHVGQMEAELYAMTIPLSERLPEFGRIMTHGVAISCDGKSFIFTAESGVGKSTHAFLWQKYLGQDRVHVINGDKPVIWLREDGEVLACGTPWSGKEHLDENVCMPLRGICLLKRLGDDPQGPRMIRATKEEAFDFLMHQIFLPSVSSGQIKTFQLLEQLYEKVPVYWLITDMSSNGVKISSDTLLFDGR